MIRPQRPLAERRSGPVGGGFTPGALTMPDGPPPGPPEIETAKGFRHFLRQPTPEERCRLFVDPRQDDGGRTVRQLLSHLVKRMRAGFWPEGAARDNPTIPSGYTYLLQFMSHDMVQSALAVSTDPRLGAVCDNLRDSRLRLATLYGGGPIAAPALYALDGPASQTRACLRLGPMKTIGPAAPPLRDIPRVAGALADGGAPHGLSEALIADPRNDDHAIVSQLAVLFAMLHNVLVGLLPATTGDGSTLEADAIHRFLCAREACLEIYHAVIRQDVLPRLLQPAVLARYLGGAAPFLDAQTTGIPLEFSHAAFRVGHAMVRDSYVVNAAAPAAESLDDLLTRTSGRAPALMPLGANWIVQWSKFFDLGSAPNLSQRIGPQYSGGLTSEVLFPHVDGTQELGLPYRDLVSASAVGLWSVAGLVEEIGRRAPDLLKAARLADRQVRAEAVETWLSQPGAALTGPEVEALAADPPLPFFVLFEAATEADGLRLGTLGSVIVAEVVVRALGPDPGTTLAQRLEAASTRVFGRTCLGAVPDIRDMPGLVRFVTEAAGLGQAVPAFL